MQSWGPLKTEALTDKANFAPARPLPAGVSFCACERVRAAKDTNCLPTVFMLGSSLATGLLHSA